MRPFGDADQVARDAVRLQHEELVPQDRGVENDTVRDDADRPLQDAARRQAEGEAIVADRDGVARVRAALETDDVVGVTGEEVDDLPLALVSPLRTEHTGHRHDVSLTARTRSARGTSRRGDANRAVPGSPQDDTAPRRRGTPGGGTPPPSRR